MPIRVLVVDDSRFFRRRVTEMLSSDVRLSVVDAAENGQDALQKVLTLKPDVITMDIEMPIMNGIEATRRIMASRPTPILMFSSLTTEGAKATLEALEAGAVDYIPKTFDDIAHNPQDVTRLLVERVVAVGRQGVRRKQLASAGTAAPAIASAQPRAPVETLRPRSVAVPRGGFKLVAIGTSTGGPVALHKVLSLLPKNFPLPMLLIQHMPGTFTPAFAQRLDQICAISVKEAQDGDVLQPGVALLAPGGKQMQVETRAGRMLVRIKDSEPSQNYKPSVDLTFTSIADTVNAPVLAIILTGMGADGCKGAQLLKQRGASIWVQDEATSVVYGMPHAVAAAGISDQILALDEIGVQLAKLV